MLNSQECISSRVAARRRSAIKYALRLRCTRAGLLLRTDDAYLGPSGRLRRGQTEGTARWFEKAGFASLEKRDFSDNTRGYIDADRVHCLSGEVINPLGLRNETINRAGNRKGI